jgi:hypothetical protein
MMRDSALLPFISPSCANPQDQTSARSKCHLRESLGFVSRKWKSMDLGKGPEDMLLMAFVW